MLRQLALKAQRAVALSGMLRSLANILTKTAQMRLDMWETFDSDRSSKVKVLEEQTKVDSLEATVTEMQRMIGESSSDDFLEQIQRLGGQVVELSRRISDSCQRASNRHKMKVLKKELEATKATLTDQMDQGRVHLGDFWKARDYFGRIQARVESLERYGQDSYLSDVVSTQAAVMRKRLQEVHSKLKAVPEPGCSSDYIDRCNPPRGWVESMEADPTYSPSNQKK